MLQVMTEHERKALNLQSQLDIANNKLKEVKEKCNKELNWIIVENEGKNQ